MGESIDRIKKFNIFDDAFHYDNLVDEFPFLIDKDTLFFLPRIDTKFTKLDFYSIFKILTKNKLIHIVLTPAELIDSHFIINVIKIRILSILRRNKLVFCGYARTKQEFMQSWDTYYSLVKNMNNKIFFLKKRM